MRSIRTAVHVLLADQLKPVPAQQSSQSVRDYVMHAMIFNLTLICIYIRGRYYADQ